MKRIYTRGDPVIRAVQHTRIDTKTGCWEWIGTHSTQGYARINIGNGKTAQVSRLFYEHYIGPIPDGLELDHLCRNRGCVNPRHVEPVTHKDNVRRGEAAVFRRLGTCRRGHDMAVHGYHRQDGKGWNCRECRRENRARQRDYW